MTNHLHALIPIGEIRLGKVVQRIALRYSRYRHKQLRTTGHLFERRHGAFLVDADTYFITLLRYIHLNPVEAGMVDSADDYPWSSHRAYSGNVVLPWLTVEFGLSLLSKTDVGARQAYRQLMLGERDADESNSPNLLPSTDPRVMGETKSNLSLEEMTAEVCATFKVSREDVRAGNRRRRFTAVRTQIARRAVDERIASLRQSARFLNRSVSAICQLLERAELGK